MTFKLKSNTPALALKIGFHTLTWNVKTFNSTKI